MLRTGSPAVPTPYPEADGIRAWPPRRSVTVRIGTLLRQGTRGLTRPAAVGAAVAYVVGALLLVWSASIHFHLWDSVGYRSIPTVGALFVVQSIAGIVVAVGVIAFRRVWAGLAGAGFSAGTLLGFVLTVSLPKGLFDFKDSWQAPFAQEAFGIELAAAVVLLAATALCVAGPRRTD